MLNLHLNWYLHSPIPKSQLSSIDPMTERNCLPVPDVLSQESALAVKAVESEKLICELQLILSNTNDRRNGDSRDNTAVGSFDEIHWLVNDKRWRYSALLIAIFHLWYFHFWGDCFDKKK